MSISAEDAARAALRQRQGPGARYDSPNAPAKELTWARRGTAYFARVLAQLPDSELDRPSLLPGWSRRHVIAHVGYNARALTRLLTWARTGVETPMYASPEQRAAEIESGATLPARALRSLFSHSEVHLNVAWRDLPDEAWDAVRTACMAAPARARGCARGRCVQSISTTRVPRLPADLLDELLADAAHVATP